MQSPLVSWSCFFCCDSGRHLSNLFFVVLGSILLTVLLQCFSRLKWGRFRPFGPGSIQSQAECWFCKGVSFSVVPAMTSADGFCPSATDLKFPCIVLNAWSCSAAWYCILFNKQCYFGKSSKQPFHFVVLTANFCHPAYIPNPNTCKVTNNISVINRVNDVRWIKLHSS